MKVETTTGILSDAIQKAYHKTGWTLAQLVEAASQYGTVDDETVRVFLRGGNSYETTLSLLLLALDLKMVSRAGVNLNGPPLTLPDAKVEIRQAHATDPANRIIFNAIMKAWHATEGDDGNKWSINRLWRECQKFGHINNSTVYMFVTGQRNVRESQLNLFLHALHLHVK